MGCQIPTNSENKVLKLGFEFKYFGTVYSEININENGFVCLGRNEACDGFIITRPYPHDILVGLNFDLDLWGRYGRKRGQIYFKKLCPDTAAADYTLVKGFLNDFNPRFSPKNMFSITFDEVWEYYASNRNPITPASFQIFLVSDDIMSYVIFKYTSCLKGETLLASSGLNHNNQGILESVNIIDGEQCTGSNVNERGVWVFEAKSISSRKSFFF